MWPLLGDARGLPGAPRAAPRTLVGALAGGRGGENATTTPGRPMVLRLVHAVFVHSSLLFRCAPGLFVVCAVGGIPE